jgi:hypothetical protein
MIWKIGTVGAELLVEGITENLRLQASIARSPAFVPTRLSLDKISSGGRVLSLSRPLATSISRQEDCYIVDTSMPFLIAMGDTLEMALDEYQQHFLHTWDEIGLEDDDNLAQDAIEVKRFQQGIVERA